MTNVTYFIGHKEYRKDIDGLRAVAILSVIGFHSAPGRVPGGFIGVDIFFVISGFLISSIILSSLQQGNFSFTEFYSRRIKRLYPALLLVLFAAFTIGWFLLVADEFRQLGKHIAGGAGFASNLVLWTESSYFDNAAETKPLLHLWSLGVEEQFYIFWPLILWITWKWRINFLMMVLVIIFFSYSVGIYYANTNIVSAFYLPQARFWEFSVGGLLSYVKLNKRAAYCTSTFANNAFTVFGAVLLVTGIGVINKENLFPGWWVVLPIAGTALLILGGRNAWINRVILSNRALVWIGLISYPLYLWHWLLLSFLRILHGEVAPQRERFLAVLISIFLAWLTYTFI